MSVASLPSGPPTVLDASLFDGPVLDGHALTTADVHDRRVAVLATGPLAVDVVPRVVADAVLTKVFLLAPVRIVPPVPLVGALASRPDLEARLGRAYLRREVRDKELRRKLTASDADAPVVVSGDYLATLQSERCQVLAWPIVEVTARGIWTGDGLEHLVDVLVRA